MLGRLDLTLLVLVLAPDLVHAQLTSEVQIESGPIRGQLNPLFNIAIYRGIPYGTAQRFADPTTPPSWSDVRLMQENGPMCPQQTCHGILAQYMCSPTESEECLMLNVYVPMAGARPLPVVVWLHGGNFDFGTAGSTLYDGSYFASVGGVIHVAINYRLGPLGYLAVFGAGEGQSLEANWGLKDQIHALRWVQRNIAAFGGDPGQVTVMGQSAGAQSVAAMLTSNPSDPEVLFHKAILHSLPGSMPWKNYSTAQVQSEAFASHVGCPFNDLACLRSVSLDVIKAAHWNYDVRHALPHSPVICTEPWAPIIDGNLVKMQVLKALATGHFRPMPVMAGSTLDDGLLYSVYFANKTELTAQEYEGFLKSWFSSEAAVAGILQRYPPDNHDEAMDAFNAVVTDYVFLCPTRLLLRAFSKAAQPAWQWVFAQPPSLPFVAGLGTMCIGKVCHGSDILFLFNSQLVSGFPTALITDLPLARQIAKRWGGFASASTDPNAVPYAMWPTVQPASPSPSLRLLTLFAHVEQDHRSDFCDFFDSLGYPVS